MFNIFKEKMAAKNAKSPDVKIVDKFIHPLLYFRVSQKKIQYRREWKCLRQLVSCCALSQADGMDIFVAWSCMVRIWTPVANEANYTMASWESLALLKYCDKGSDWFQYLHAEYLSNCSLGLTYLLKREIHINMDIFGDKRASKNNYSALCFSKSALKKLINWRNVFLFV